MRKMALGRGRHKPCSRACVNHEVRANLVMRSITLSLLLVSLFALTSCFSSTAPSWLQGSWSFDSERTSQANKFSENSTPLTELLGSLATALVAPALTSMEVKITNKEVMVLNNGSGETQPYEIIENKADQCMLKTADGKVSTWFHDGEAVYRYAENGGKLQLYFKRKL